MREVHAHSEVWSHRLGRAALKRVLIAQMRMEQRPIPKNDRGQFLDAATFALLRNLQLAEAKGSRSVGRMRSDYDELGPMLDLARTPLHHVEDRSLGEGDARFRVRIYTPVKTKLRSPAILFFHGGGFVLGSLRSHDGALRKLAALTRAIVIAVDYRLVPEHRTPAAYEDGLFAYRWLREEAEHLGVDASRILLSGDSAGGNLTLSTALSIRDQGLPPPAALLPIYPMTDATGSFPSRERLSEGFFLTRDLLHWFEERFVHDPKLSHDPRVSVLQADPKGLPRSHFVTAGFDPLRDEGEAMMQRARDAGVDVTHRSEDALVHGFITFGGVLPLAEAAHARIADMAAQILYR
jgi:acetyl esterase